MFIFFLEEDQIKGCDLGLIRVTSSDEGDYYWGGIYHPTLMKITKKFLNELFACCCAYEFDDLT